MVTYVATVYAKTGHEDEVAAFYQDLAPLSDRAKGFRGRQILKARPGTMVEAVLRIMTAEELAGHREPPHEEPQGVHFIIIETWDSVDDRIAFSRGLGKARNKALFPHLLPEHSHEFYEDVSTT
jgi:quinol monooxygenase YgiN